MPGTLRKIAVEEAFTALSSPGVQMFDADTACELASLANDHLAQVIARQAGRFAGLAAVAPQAPQRAVKEMERAIRSLKLNGFILNSHTHDQDLDDPKYWPILEAAEALDACIYLHPRAASAGLNRPMRDYGMEIMWGFGVEVGTHVVRLMASGVLDRFPKLAFCIEHMGEAVPFWIWRINYLNQVPQHSGRAPKTQLSMHEYLTRNFVITTSGVEDPQALEYSVKTLGAERVLWAIDYPYQPTAPAVRFMDNVAVSDGDRGTHLRQERRARLPHWPLIRNTRGHSPAVMRQRDPKKRKRPARSFYDRRAESSSQRAVREAAIQNDLTGG